MQRIRTIDSHTGGEPTRVVIEGGPNLGQGLFAERFERLKSEYDSLRSTVVNEPRGSDVLVGALLCEPDEISCVAGVMFFNNRGFLGMCGHGTIGLVMTLDYLGRIGPGTHRIQTPAGIVVAELTNDREVAVENVPSYRWKRSVTVDVPELGRVTGDIAYGGNWFFLVERDMGTLDLSRASQLTEHAWQIRRALQANSIAGDRGAEIDHIEFFSAPHDPANHSRNFVLCPGGAYDRSPCGTGTSAKLACLAADGKLAEGDLWRQESVIGSVFTCSYQIAAEPDQIVPTIRGTGYLTGENTLLLDPDDPFCTGIQ